LNGAIEKGRDIGLVGAHCRGQNSDSWGICLINNMDFFRTKPPSELQLHSLDNALVYLQGLSGKELQIFGHSDFGKLTCPGGAVPINDIAQKAYRRFRKIRHEERYAVTADLRRLFANKIIKLSEPDQGCEMLAKRGINRIVYPYHWRLREWEDMSVAIKWAEAAREHGIDLFLYTRPFGTETKLSFEKYRLKKEWLQTKENGDIAYYDKDGLLMFCPTSDYLKDYRLPAMESFAQETQCDGVFFDIPWVMNGACYCERCRASRDKFKKRKLEYNENIVRKSLAEAVLSLRRKFPDIFLAANAAAPDVWNSKHTGATPISMSGLFDELIVEWSPKTQTAIKKVESSIDSVRKNAPACRVSHAWRSDLIQSDDLRNSVVKMNEEASVGVWHCDRLLTAISIKK
jgi:hypothetical protein